MSDFISSFWSWYVIAIVVGGLAFCVFVLAVASKRTVMADDNSTGHTWDEDLRELNNPLPRWWMGLFIITVVFASIYLSLYPGLGNSKGNLGWTSAGQLEAEHAKAREAMAKVYEPFMAMTPEALMADQKAMGIGERLFANNCAGCHGADARGSKGFPNLTDNDWLGGSGVDYIAKTIAEGRRGVMPPMVAAVGTPEDVKNVANYVLSLSGSSHNSIAAQLGKSKFGVCAACHGADAHGSKSFPNLTDSDWLGGTGADYIKKTVTEGRQGVMPPMAAAVGTADDVKNVANYVLSLSGGAHNNVAAQLGKPKFAACAACHGPEGKGNQALGAPNLTDKIWLHGWGEAAIMEMVNKGKTNVMPAHTSRLTPEQIRVLAAYVWSLSHKDAKQTAMAQ